MKRKYLQSGFHRWSLLCMMLFGAVSGVVADNGGDRGNLHAVIVVSDLTEDGRKIEHPSKEKPVFYVPRVIGYQAIGEVSAGELPVKPELLLHEAAKALAKEGYLVATKTTSAPTLVLLFQWGYLKPTRNDEGAIMMDLEGKKMTGLIAGQKAGDLYPKFDSELIDETSEDRYFILIAAYDLKEYQEHKQKKLLWVTKMSTPMTKTTLEDVAPMLIAQGQPLFGRQSGHPHVEIIPEAKEGKVEAGQLKVIDLIDGSEQKQTERKK